MTHTRLCSQFVGMVMTLACGLTLAQGRSGAAQETGSPASQPAAGKSTAAPVRTYNLQFSTYFGGSGGEYLRGMDIDAQGNIYVAGTLSGDGPTTPGVFQRKGGRGWVAKFSPTGELIWSTHFGDGACTLFSVKVDSAGFVYVSGNNGPGLPVTAGVFQPTYGGTGNSTNQSGFVAKLKPDASGLVWASYVGNGYSCRDMTMNDEGNIYCALAYDAQSKYILPASWFASAYDKTPHGATGGKGHFGACDCGVIKISNDGSKVIWATWLGGSTGNDWVGSVAVGSDHCPVIMLNTYSTDMPTTLAAFCRTCSLSWVGKLSADGSKLLLGTYTGVMSGTPFARTHNVALDQHGNIFIAFQAHSCPVTPGAFQPKCGGQDDYAIEKISPSGALLAATFIGGSGLELNGPDQITVDRKGDVVIVGCTNSTDYPVTGGAFQPKNGGAGGKYPFDGVVSILSNDLSTLLYSSYIGGSGDEMARACAVGPDGTLCVGGVTTSKDFPTKNAYQRTYAGDPGFGSAPNGGSAPVGWGNGDCWLAKLSPVVGRPPYEDSRLKGSVGCRLGNTHYFAAAGTGPWFLLPKEP